MAQPEFRAAGAALSVDVARLKTLAAVAPVAGTETLPLEAARGRILAEAPTAATALPPFDNSAMDGYAIRRADLVGAGPFRLTVAQRIIAGAAPRAPLQPGTAARIFTGAVLPEGADAVVMQERVQRVGDEIILDEPPAPGLNIRRAGEDLPLGAEALAPGMVLTAPRLGLLAGSGVFRVTLRRRLRVGLFSTGNELREPGEALGRGQIYNSNRIMLRAMLEDPWVNLTDYGILPDDPALIRQTIRDASAAQDVVISSGGVSAGEEDHVLDALTRESAALDVLKVAIRPGKPLTVGRVGAALYLGLPGNPYAAAITFSQIARPALRKAAGLLEPLDNWIPAVSGFDYARTPGRLEYIPVSWESRDALGRPILNCLGRGASARLAPIAMAQGIAAIEAEVEHVVPGLPLRVEPLANG